MSHRRKQNKYQGAMERLSGLLSHMGSLWTGCVESASDQFIDGRKREEFSPGS